MDITITFQEPQHQYLARCIASPYVLAPAFRINLVNFDFFAQYGGLIADNFFVNGLAKLVKKQDCGIAIYTC
ncbi:hypothetical protein OA249_02000 [Litorivicinus sp.]|nr:hypothetical protein [Litorivicinus sp.]